MRLFLGPFALAASGLRWYFSRTFATLGVASLLVLVYAALRVFAEAGDVDSINRGLILQGDWVERGGWQWAALFTNGFVTLSLDALLGTIVLVIVTLPWLEKRIGSAAALALVLGLAWVLGPIKIMMGGPGAVGVSKFTFMLQTFWLADNPLLLWIGNRVRHWARRRGNEGVAVIAAPLARYAGWVPALWLAWGPFTDDNPTHAISVAVGLALAAVHAWRGPPWLAAREADAKDAVTGAPVVIDSIP